MVRSTSVERREDLTAARSFAAYQGDEHRTADERGHDADLQLARAHDGAAEYVGEQQQGRSEEHRVRQHPPVVGTHQAAGGMRNGKADESDRASRRGRRATEQHDRQRREGPHPPDMRPERPAGVVAERQRVEGTRDGQRQHGADGEERQQLQHHVHRPPRQRADDPEPELVECGGVEGDHCLGERDQGERHGRARERHPDRARTAPAAGSQRVDQDRGDGRAGKGEPHVRPEARQAEERDRGDHCGGGSGVDAEDAGVGEWIAGQRLHQRAGEAERGAGGEAEQRPGDPELADDLVVGGRPRMA